MSEEIKNEELENTLEEEKKMHQDDIMNYEGKLEVERIFHISTNDINEQLKNKIASMIAIIIKRNLC